MLQLLVTTGWLMHNQVDRIQKSIGTIAFGDGREGNAVAED